MKKRTDTASFLWLALVLFIALTIAFLLPVTPQDYWWYLRVGRDTLASGARAAPGHTDLHPGRHAGGLPLVGRGSALLAGL